jgi:hypothetical protein
MSFMQRWDLYKTRAYEMILNPVSQLEFYDVLLNMAEQIILARTCNETRSYI